MICPRCNDRGEVDAGVDRETGTYLSRPCPWRAPETEEPPTQGVTMEISSTRRRIAVASLAGAAVLALLTPIPSQGAES